MVLAGASVGGGVAAWVVGTVVSGSAAAVVGGAAAVVVASPADMVAAVGLVEQIDRRACRAEVAARFSTERMSGRYAALYQSLARNRLNRRAQPYLQSSRDARSRIAAS